MPKTFAYSNKGNYWKTRYSFLPTHYSHVNKEMYSFPTVTSSAPADVTAKSMPWLHNSGENCRYYNAPSVAALSLSFNDFVSNNKMYRALSIEGSNTINGSAIVSVNNSSSPNQIKTTTSINFKDKGGVLYSGLSGNNLRSNASIVTLGTTTGVDFVNYTNGRLLLMFQMDWVRGAKAKLFRSTTLETGLWTVLPNGQISKLLIAPSGVGSPVQVANWQIADTDIFNTTVGSTNSSNFYGANGFLVRFDFNELYPDNPELIPANISAASEVFIDAYSAQVGLGPTLVGLTLVALTPDEVNGGKPQGQFADMVINLGTNDWELYALNAYYEANTLDHSK